MPRGRQAKAMRAHNRACMAGRSTRGSSMVAQSQKGGKMYKKGETSQKHDASQKLQQNITYGGIEYNIILRLDNGKLICQGIYDKKKVWCSMQAGKKMDITHAKVTDERLMKNIIGMYMLSKEQPELYERMRQHEVNVIM